ncbi:hypothetical protein GQR58_003303 [Nymphon striatum]|nr:hypothetical protein GQR58_003303 [Nymphon striatum]
MHQLTVAFHEYSVEEVVNFQQKTPYPVIRISKGGNGLITVNPDSSRENIYSILIEDNLVKNSLGHHLGTVYADIYTYGQTEKCQSGVEDMSGKVLCYAPKTPNILYVFNGRWDGPDNKMPPAEILQDWILESIVWLFLLISIIIFGFMVLLVRQIKKDGQLSQEKLTRLTALIFIPAVLIFGLVFYGLSSWRSDIKFQESQVEIEKFVRGVYNPLVDSQRSLLMSVSNMRDLQDSIAPLRSEHANHADLLRNIALEWNSSQQTLYKLYRETDKEIRHAWISYKTMNQQDVLDKFYTKAVKLNDRILKVDKDYQVGVRGAKDELIKSVDSARFLLDGKKKKQKSKPKKRKKKDKKSREIKEKKDSQDSIVIVDFKSNTTTTLLAHLSRLDEGLEIETKRLREDIRVAKQRQEEVRLYLEDNSDLIQPLSKVIDGWKQLETSNHKYLNLVLYAIEAEYLARKLGLSKKDPAILGMHKSLKLIIPDIVSNATSKREALERSYSIK